MNEYIQTLSYRYINTLTITVNVCMFECMCILIGCFFLWFLLFGEGDLTIIPYVILKSLGYCNCQLVNWQQFVCVFFFALLLKNNQFNFIRFFCVHFLLTSEPVKLHVDLEASSNFCLHLCLCNYRVLLHFLSSSSLIRQFSKLEINYK